MAEPRRYSIFAELRNDTWSVVMRFADGDTLTNMMLAANTNARARAVLWAYMQTHAGLIPFSLHELANNVVYPPNSKALMDRYGDHILDWVEEGMCKWAAEVHFPMLVTMRRLKIMCDLLVRNPILELVSFWMGSDLTEETVEYFASRLGEVPRPIVIRILGARATNLGDLITVKTRELMLMSCHVDFIAASGIADALRANTSVQQLWIYDDDTFTSEGLEVILDALEENHTSRRMYVTDCPNIGRDSWERLRVLMA